MTVEELDHLENLADQINQALGIREQMPELQASAARDRQAATRYSSMRTMRCARPLPTCVARKTT